MFTIADFERARNGVSSKGLLEDILFTVEKNPIAYALNLHNNHYRGYYTERMAANKLIDHNFNVFHYGKDHDYDLLINNSIRAEVKLATLTATNRGNSTKYTFCKVKPECFDVLFLVFLNPMGLTIKWTTSEMVHEWKTGYKRGVEGYNISFNKKLACSNLVYNESFDSFVRLYSQSISLCA